MMDRLSMRGSIHQGAEALSGEQLLHHLALDVGQSKVSALEAICQARVIEAQTVEQGGVEIVNRNGVFHDVVADVICASHGYAWFNAAARGPHRKGAWMMVASQKFRSAARFVHRSAPELAAPNYQGRVEQSALLQVFHQSGSRLIGGAAKLRKPVDDV